MVYNLYTLPHCFIILETLSLFFCADISTPLAVYIPAFDHSACGIARGTDCLGRKHI